MARAAELAKPVRGNMSLAPRALIPTSSNIVCPDITTSNGTLRIGSASIPLGTVMQPELVPSVLFYPIPKHRRLLEEMLRDFALGDHLLLVGNQGVGKNKLCDRLLELMRRERHYIQLHRDTTVQALTLAPSLEAGVVVWRDSPLGQWNSAVIVSVCLCGCVRVWCVLHEPQTQFS